MKKLFKAIRDYDLDAVKEIIEKKPSVIDEPSAPPPKKDAGQSPLMVALKIEAFDIAEYLIDKGADVNFSESEKHNGYQPLLHDAIRTAIYTLCSNRRDDSDRGVELIIKLCEKGADPNKRAFNGYDAINKAVCDAELILERQSAYPDSQDYTEQQLMRIIDILREYGADFKGWAERGHYPLPTPGESNRSLYLDDFVPVEDKTIEVNFRGKKETVLIKGDIDRTAHTRKVMQEYIRTRGIII